MIFEAGDMEGNIPAQGNSYISDEKKEIPEEPGPKTPLPDKPGIEEPNKTKPEPEKPMPEKPGIQEPDKKEPSPEVPDRELPNPPSKMPIGDPGHDDETRKKIHTSETEEYYE
jgi:hypothetical protein